MAPRTLVLAVAHAVNAVALQPLQLGEAGGASSPPGSLCDAGGGWDIVWRDEFDAPLNRTVWTIPVGVGSSLGREANVTEEDTYVQDGALVLRSRVLPGSGKKNWTTGAAITNRRNYPATPGNVGMAWQYGRFCVRAKLPGAGPGKSAGLWPAHGMMPADYSKHCGYCELDIMEMVDGNGQADGKTDASPQLIAHTSTSTSCSCSALGSVQAMLTEVPCCARTSLCTCIVSHIDMIRYVLVLGRRSGRAAGQQQLHWQAFASRLGQRQGT
jgi:hypothetical protein